MLKVLLKKQLMEVFRNYFYDPKKNKMRSKWAIAGWIIFFVAVMVGVLGGMFTGLSITLCAPLASVGLGWMYFLIMCGIAILLGAFGGVFNSYAGLYLAKDNDLLLSLPIPVRTIVTARLVNVYVLGAMYAATALLPMLIVYWVTAGATAARVVCGIVLFVIVTLFVMLLSCLLGWVVAKLSQRLKNKSFITVLVALVFIGAYYFFYFRAQSVLNDILMNAEAYGARLEGSARWLCLFGRIGEGSWSAALIFLAVTAVLLVLVWLVLSRTFLRLAVGGGKTEKVRYVEKTAREKTAFGALLGKEFGRFASSPNYMLNCGLGVLLLPVGGAALLIRGRAACEALESVFADRPGSASVLLCAALCLIASMNDMATPSVSLEGKSLWIPQSLPVRPRTVLRAKAAVELILTGLPMLFAAACAAGVVEAPPAERLMLFVMPLAFTAFKAASNTVLGVKMPLLTWTNELAPIKQSGAVAIALFGCWGVTVVLAGVYLIAGYRIGAAAYMLVWTVLLAAAGLLLLKWLDTKGADTFAVL